MTPPPSPRSTFSRYAVAVAAALAALLGEIILTPTLTERSPWSLFSLAIVVAGWWGGFRPALLATLLTAAGGLWFLIEPHWTFHVRDAHQAAEFTVFVVTGIAISAIARSMHRGQRRARVQDEAIRESEERLRLASEATEDIVWDWDLTTDRVHWSVAMAKNFGWPEALPFTAAPWWQERIHHEDRERTVASLRAVVADRTRDRWEAEYRFRRGDGTFAEVLDRGHALRDARGHAVRMIGATLDLTVRREAEAAVRHSREELQGIIDAVPALIAFVDQDLTYRWNSRGYERWFHRPLAEITGRPVREVLGDAAFAIIRPRLEQALAGKLTEYEEFLPHVGVSGRWVNAIFALQRRPDGEPGGVVVSVTDISERKQAELSQAALAAIVENSDDAIIGKTLDGMITSWNRAAERLFGFTAKEMIGENLSRYFPAERLAEEDVILAAVRVGQSSGHYESQRRTKDGRLIDVAVSTSPIHDRTGAVVGASTIARDITDQKRAEAAMLDGAEQRRLALESADLGSWNYRFATGELLGDERCFRMLGVIAEKMTLAEAMSRVLPADRALLKTAARAALAGENAGKFRIEIRVRRPDGSLRTLNLHGRVFFTGAPGERQPLRFIGVSMDVTESTRAQDTLRKSEQSWRQLAEAMPHLVWTCRPDGYCDYLSSQWVAYTGRPEADHLGSGWTDAVHPTDLPATYAAWQRSVTSGETFDVELRIRRFDGEYRWFKSRAVPARDEAVRIVKWFGSNTDIEDLKRAEAAAWDAAGQRRIALDTAEAANRAKDEFLAALSHELRTPLTPVLFVAASQERAPDLPPGVREDFAMIRRNIELEARLIDDLLDVTRITRGKLQLSCEPTDLHEILHRSLEMLRNEIDARHLALHLDLAADHHQSNADPVRLQQVFWNILKNAVKFTPEGGRIAVRSSSPDRKRWLLTISDSGLGITSEELPLIFNAFAQGSEASSHRFGGLGLGLAISGLLVREHRGRIWAESPGRHQGSTFHVELPLDHAPAAAAPVRPTPTASTESRRILVVEDHDATRLTLLRVLSRRGYEVACAGDLASARALAATGSFDLMISDLGLPDGSGRELVAEFLRDYGLKAIALSGFGMEEDVNQSMLAGFLDHLTKPVDLEALYDAIDRAIETSAAAP